MGDPGYMIETEMAYHWAPLRHNRKKGCWLFVEVPIYFELEPMNFELNSYLCILAFYVVRSFVVSLPGYIIASG